MSDIQKIFAANVRMYRKRAHMTQEELAEKSGLHRTYIGGIEQQRINVSLKNVEKIAHALEVDPMLLFMRENSLQQEKELDEQTKRAEGLSKGEYALCTWTEDGIVLKPLDVKREDLTISILCALINEGHENDLAEAYDRAQQEIISFFRASRNHKLDEPPDLLDS